MRVYAFATKYKEKWKMKRFIYITFTVWMLLLSGKMVYAQETEYMTNLVLFVSFSDTEEDYWNQVITASTGYNVADNVNRVYNETGVAKGLCVKDYFTLASCGKLELDSVMPQMSNDGEHYVIVPVTLDLETSVYNATDDYKLLSDVIEKINSDTVLSQQLKESSQKLDRDEDGYIDNVTFLTACDDVSGRSSSLYPHKAEGAGYGLRLGGISMDCYNVINYGRFGSVNGGAGVVSHELLHVLGPLDTYVVCDSSAGNCDTCPVGCWDIMATNGSFVQYPLAYTRKELGWIDMAEVETSGSYTLTYPQKDSNQYAMILKTPYSDTEFFVVEYRKRAEDNFLYSTNGVDKIDRGIGGSGIIIYRVNTAANPKSNLYSNYIYVFRSGEGEDEATKIGAAQAYFSEESERISFGSSDAAATSEDGAITYTDGTNSGIVIKNVGGAGETITFDVEYTIDMTGESWDRENFQNISKDMGNGVDSILFNQQLYGGNVPMVQYQNALYAIYSDGGNAQLLRLENGAWEMVQTLATDSQGMDITVGNDGLLYMVCEQNYATINLYQMDANGTIKSLSESQKLQGNAASPQLVATEAGPVVVYRDWTNGDKIYAYLFRDNQWKQLKFPNEITSNRFSVGSYKNKIYLTTANVENNYVYECDLSLSDTFRECGSAFSQNKISSVGLAVDDDGIVYVAYLDSVRACILVKGYQNGEWAQLGMNVYSQKDISDVGVNIAQGRLYVSYQVGTDIGVKSHNIFASSGETSGDGDINEKEKDKDTGEEKDGNTGEKKDKDTEEVRDQNTGENSKDDNGGDAEKNKEDTLRVGEKIRKGSYEYMITETDKGKEAVELLKPLNQNGTTYTVPSFIMIENTKYKVTSIGKNAFANEKNVKKVTIGKNVSVIQAGAFSGCKKLKQVSMGKNVTTIGDKAFYKCKALTQITIPSRVKKIGKKAFYGCKGLKSITIKTSKLKSRTVGKQAFSGISKKVVVKVQKKKKKVYRKLLTAKGLPKKASVKVIQ
jgi:M6 family metalloprotease-like protein